MGLIWAGLGGLNRQNRRETSPGEEARQSSLGAPKPIPGILCGPALQFAGVSL